MCKFIEKDGDSIKINSYLAIASFIILILTLLSSVIALTVSAQNDIDSNYDKLLISENQIKSNQESIRLNENRLIIIETQYSNIIEALDRIEAKVK